MNHPMTNSDLCTRRRWRFKIALNGLHLRRAELARDCVQFNTKDAKMSESTLTSDEVQAFSNFVPRVRSTSTMFVMEENWMASLYFCSANSGCCFISLFTY
ncbi:unnamed protein product [Angiostrongylus costaricensis]|uniref:Uncharacterized protein n=1 Tax=Angiostrongylus costaricensis TaxID=334426 RepID=A0A0R3PF33_ANGCS|nr:unnamed protein product [Angiostrongylus costaricensis]